MDKWKIWKIQQAYKRPSIQQVSEESSFCYAEFPIKVML